MQQAIVLVDIQNDFLPSGALPVPCGDEVIAVANRLTAGLRECLVFATQDWHPPAHQSFASQHPGHRPYDVIELHGVEQVLWPEHCVQHSFGAAFATALDLGRVARVVPKGLDATVDSYSGFFDNARRRATGLDALLHERGVTGVIVLGLATDYCVSATCLDALELGYATTLVLDGCRGVDVRAGDSDAAIAAIASRGGRITTSDALLAR